MILADSFWERNSTVILLIATVAVSVIGWWLLWLWRQKDKDSKHLDYRVIEDIPILAGGHNRPEKLRVTFGPLEVNDPRVTQVRFKNTGKQVIDEADFLGQPYEIVRSDAKLLTFRVFAGSARDSRDLVEKLEQVVAKPETLNVYPKTLNSGDWFTVQLVYDGGAWDQPPTVTGRIRGRTRESAIYPTGEELIGTTEPFIWTAGTFGAFFVLLGALIFVINYSPATHLVGLIIFGAGIVIVMAGVVLSFSSRRRLYATLQAGTQITESD